MAGDMELWEIHSDPREWTGTRDTKSHTGSQWYFFTISRFCFIYLFVKSSEVEVTVWQVSTVLGPVSLCRMVESISPPCHQPAAPPPLLEGSEQLPVLSCPQRPVWGRAGWGLSLGRQPQSLTQVQGHGSEVLPARCCVWLPGSRLRPRGCAHVLDGRARQPGAQEPRDTPGQGILRAGQPSLQGKPAAQHLRQPSGWEGSVERGAPLKLWAERGVV